MKQNLNELQVGIAELEQGLADEKAVHEETKRQLRVVNSLYQKQQQRITELEQAAKHFYDFATKYRSFGLWNSEEARALAKALAFKLSGSVPSLSSDQEIGMLRNLQLLDQIERLEAEKKHEKHENPLTQQTPLSKGSLIPMKIRHKASNRRVRRPKRQEAEQ